MDDGPRQRRVSVYSPSSYCVNEVALSMVCNEILSNGGLVTANWQSIISLVLQIFNFMPL